MSIDVYSLSISLPSFTIFEIPHDSTDMSSYSLGVQIEDQALELLKKGNFSLCIAKGKPQGAPSPSVAWYSTHKYAKTLISKLCIEITRNSYLSENKITWSDKYKMFGALNSSLAGTTEQKDIQFGWCN
jgi:hypothetical protein